MTSQQWKDWTRFIVENAERERRQREADEVVAWLWLDMQRKRKLDQIKQEEIG